MVHFPASCPSSPMCSAGGRCHPGSGVTPFGDPWIVGRWHLPTAFRSCPRPSSPGGSQASSMNPCSLDHIILSIPALLNVKKHLGLTRLELVTSCLSGTRSNHLSYSPDRYIREEKSSLRLFPSYWWVLPPPDNVLSCRRRTVRSSPAFPFFLERR